MKILLYLLQKEFIQIFRNKTLLPLIFVLPLVQLLVLVNAATQELKKAEIIIVDYDLSGYSRQLEGKFEASPFFKVESITQNINNAQKEFKATKTSAVLVIHKGFEKNLYRQGIAPVQLQIDGIDVMKAQLIFSYSQQVISDLNREIARDISFQGSGTKINTPTRYWFNSELNYIYYMLPGILGILVTLIGLFLTAMNLVREKEMGTIEQINVTPIKKQHFIIGKLLPFLIIGLFELSLGLIIGKAVYGIPLLGNLFVLYLFAAIYLVGILGIGLFISTIAHTQQQVMFFSFFFILVFVLMSGVFTPMENMPELAQQINWINPLAYFARVIRMILLKGSGFYEVMSDIFKMSALSLFTLSLAILNYRKTA